MTPRHAEVQLTGGYAPRFQAYSVAQAGSVKMALSCSTRQQVTHTVGQKKKVGNSSNSETSTYGYKRI